MGLWNDDLQCGAHEPRDEDAARDVIRRGETIAWVLNNCSGKHSGLLTTALHLGKPTAGYTDAAHPAPHEGVENHGGTVDGCRLESIEILV